MKDEVLFKLRKWESEIKLKNAAKKAVPEDVLEPVVKEAVEVADPPAPWWSCCVPKKKPVSTQLAVPESTTQ